MHLLFLSIAVAISLLFSGGLLLPLGWLESLNVSIWFWFAIAFALFSWLIGD
jgi:hypothetical protein